MLREISNSDNWITRFPLGNAQIRLLLRTLGIVHSEINSGGGTLLSLTEAAGNSVPVWEGTVVPRTWEKSTDSELLLQTPKYEKQDLPHMGQADEWNSLCPKGACCGYPGNWPVGEFPSPQVFSSDHEEPGREAENSLRAALALLCHRHSVMS